jgi:hypothetical protein
MKNRTADAVFTDAASVQQDRFNEDDAGSILPPFHEAAIQAG